MLLQEFENKIDWGQEHFSPSTTTASGHDESEHKQFLGMEFEQ